MVKKITAFLLSVVLTASLTAVPVLADTEAGQPITEAEQGFGTSDIPVVEISSYENLEAFISGINDGTIDPRTNAVLLADITVPASVGNDWVPLSADWDHAYKGVFDGSEHTISGISVSRSYPDEWSEGTAVHNYTAFISFLAEEGTVKDLTVQADITDVNDVAGIVSQNFGRIEGCTFSGVLESNIYPNAGGGISPFYPDGVFDDYSGESGCIAAANTGEIVDCDTTADSKVFRGGINCGGIAGTNREEGIIADCTNYALVYIEATSYPVSAVYSGGAGGIAGAQLFSEEADPKYAPFISSCENYGQVTCDTSTGGICGNVTGGTIFGCDNAGIVDGVILWGGGIVGFMGTNLNLTGENASMVIGNVNMGSINPQADPAEGAAYSGSYIGGIAGYVEDAFSMTDDRHAQVIVQENMNVGNVTGRFSVGGVFGLVSNGLDHETGVNQISEQVNLGLVTGNNNTGGIAGSCPGALSACCNYGKVVLRPVSEDPEDVFSTGGIAGYCGLTGSVDTSINLGGVFVEEGESKEVYIGGGAGVSAGKLPGCYYCANTSGEARRLIGSNPDLLKGALSLPSMSDEAALTSMPELFDGATGHHPVVWDLMHNVEIEGITYLMPPQIGDWPISALAIYELAGVDNTEQVYSIAGAEVTASAVYTGQVLVPDVTVDLNGLILSEGIDYDVISWPYTDAGTYPVTVTGKGDYKDIAEGTCTIEKAKSSISVKDKKAVYSGKPVASEKASVEGSSGTVTYKYFSDKGCTKKIAASKVKNVGTYYVKATVAADRNYKSATSAPAKIIISKASQELKVTQTKSQKTIKLKAGDVKKKAQTIPFSKVAKVTGNKTKLSYKKVKGASAFKVDPGTGKITVKKGTKKNTYTVKIKVTAEADNNYKADSETVTVKIKIG